jgi:Transglutaminase elicitor
LHLTPWGVKVVSPLALGAFMNHQIFNKRVGSLLFFTGSLLASPINSLSTELSDLEQAALDHRIETFYQSSDPEVMNQRILKFDVSSGSLRTRPSHFESDVKTGQPLWDAAGKKLDSSYLKSRERWLERKFHVSKFRNTWATIESGDKVDDLVESYMTEEELLRDLDKVPNRGQVSGDFWSGDYWRTNWGLTSYRYSTQKKYKLYHKAVESYSQPEEWLQIFGEPTLRSLAEEIERWSPSEKYDLLVGDAKFNLTREQKSEGEDLVKSNGEVEEWFGICDGWAPASIFVPTPKKTVITQGLGGVKIKWLPNDIRAMASLAWTNGDYDHNLVGTRCDSKHPKTYKNGRIIEQDCFDTNPATFHLALANLIGQKGIPFIMDASFDAEVWNQPILSYEFKYFNPLKPKTRSQNWKDVMVPYNDEFKEEDRFQTPMTRGRRKGKEYFDEGIKYIVGVQATVVYLTEYDATFENQPQENVTERVVYTYDLEIHEKNGQLIPKGGEWHNNTHPDFLWLPKKGSMAGEKWDKEVPKLDLSQVQTQDTTEVAVKASNKAIPFAQL